MSISDGKGVITRSTNSWKGGFSVESRTREGPIMRAVVTAIREGHHGAFFLAECDIGMITVSLSKFVWQEDDLPEGGIAVVISDIRWKRKGWRGFSARFFRPGDEELLKNEVHQQH